METNKTVNPPATGEAAHTPTPFSRGRILLDHINENRARLREDRSVESIRISKQNIAVAENEIVRACDDYSALVKVIERILAHPQLPVDSIQCLRDARVAIKTAKA